MNRSGELQKQLEQLQYGEFIARRMLELRENPAFKALHGRLLERRNSIAMTLASAPPEKVAWYQGKLNELMFLAATFDEQDESLKRNLADQARLREEIESVTLRERAYPGDPEIARLKEQLHGTEHPVREL